MAQDTCRASLSGKVVDEHDHEPLSYANIFIEELGIGAISDSAGNYTISELCDGEYTVQVGHIGCEPILKTVKVLGPTVQNFYPEHHAELLNAATVVGESPKQELTQGSQSLSEKQISETRGQSLGQSLTKISGVSTLSTGNSIAKPVIHGLHGNRILILNNGIRQEGQQWGNEHAPEIDPFIADDLTVVKGANSVRFGPDAIAGVVLVNPRSLPNDSSVKGEINFVGSSNGRQGLVSGVVDGNFAKIPDLSWRLQGTLKQSGNINSPDYFLKNTGLKEYNFSWAAGYSKPRYGIEAFYSQFNTDIGIFSASHIGNLTDLQRAFEANEPLESANFTYEIGRPWQHIEHELFKAQGYVRTGNAGKLNVTFARQYNRRLEYDKHKPLNDSLAALNLSSLQFEITTSTTDIVWEHNRVNSLKGSIGVSGIHQGNTYEGRFFIPNFRKYGLGAFWIERWKPIHSKLQLEAGIRFDYVFQEVFMWEGDEIVSPEYTFNNLSGTLGGIYKFSDEFLMRADFSTAWRPPNVSELFSDGLHHGAAAVEIGDPNLDREQAYNFSVSAEYTSSKMRINLDAYYNYIHDFIYLKPELPPTLTIRGAFPTFRYSQVDASLKGIDLTFTYELPYNLEITSMSSVIRALNETAEEYLVLMPADRHEQTLKYNLKDGDRLKDGYLSFSMLNVLRQNRVPDNSDFAPPPGAYTLFGFNAGISIKMGSDKMNIGIGVSNLTNVRYRNYLNRFRYYADEMGTNVSLRIKIPFTIVGNNSNQSKPITTNN